MRENIPAGAEALNATSDPSTAVPCPEPRMTDGPASNTVVCRLTGNTRFGAVPTDFLYTSFEPHAVTVIFHQGENKTTEWTFARDLLAEVLAGSGGSAGIGDIAFQQEGDMISLTLNPTTPDAFKFAFPRLGMAAFLSATTRVVMVGGEVYDDLDREIAELLA